MSEKKSNKYINDMESSQSYLNNITTGSINNENKRLLKNTYNSLDSYSVIDENYLIDKLGLKKASINNRRYLGNKYSLQGFIRSVVNENCDGIESVADIFCGTGSVSDAFKDKKLITNDLLYSNYISNYAFFRHEDYSRLKIIKIIYEYNKVKTNENNYMRENFSNTFFSADNCSKIGFIREDIEKKYKSKELNFKEYSILITSLLYAMDKIANTVGHYDAYRKTGDLNKELILNVILPDLSINKNNICFNKDANILINDIECDLLYLDPPYNSRQYSDSYHLLENVARWNKPKVYGVAKKMDRSELKSEYSMVSAPKAFEDLVKSAKSKYILLSYNNTSEKADGRSNAKISDEDILRILREKGEVKVFEKSYKAFNTGKTNLKDNTERLFLCKVSSKINKCNNVESPFNYTGGKFKILDQIQPILSKSNTFLDLFAGGGNVGINSNAEKIILNDFNQQVMGLIDHIKNNNTNKLLNSIDKIIKKYGLSNTAKYGYNHYNCTSGEGLSKFNKDKYLMLRSDFNKISSNNKKYYDMFYVLIVYSFNNQIRFNKKNEFNLPVGKRDFNLRMRRKFIEFSECLKSKNVEIISKDFRDIPLLLLPKDTLIYCDPPYLITNATYNENGSWNNDDEIDLLLFLDQANELGLKFALSNVTHAKSKSNDILIDWVNKNNYYCYQIDKNYSNSNYQRKESNDIVNEVLITNYEGEDYNV